jgi:hypothetical protein
VLQQLDPRFPADHYLCPICSRIFGLADLEAGEVTLEHVPSKAAARGQHMVLTCRKCNNYAGHALDSNLVHIESIRRFTTGDPLRPIDVSLDHDGIPIHVSMTWADGGYVFSGEGKPNDPALVDAFIERLQSGATTVQFKARHAIDTRAGSISLLRSGYLATFAAFGYAYVMKAALDPIRRLLNGPDDSSFVLPVLVRRVGEGANTDRMIGTLAEPSWLVDAVIVVIGQAVVILPPVLPSATDPIAALADRQGIDVVPGEFTFQRRFSWPTGPRHEFDALVVAQRRE